MVYFILDREAGAVKVGYSAAPMKRLAQLQTAIPRKLELLGAVSGDMGTEADFHRRFDKAYKKLEGEWYQANDDILDHITEILFGTKSVLAQSYPWLKDQYIACPECGCCNMHPVKVDVNAGGSITTIDHLGTHMSTGLPSGRGVLISIMFHGECCHVTVMHLQFHKGSTDVEIDSRGEISCDDLNCPSYGYVIWRD